MLVKLKHFFLFFVFFIYFFMLNFLFMFKNLIIYYKDEPNPEYEP